MSLVSHANHSLLKLLFLIKLFVLQDNVFVNVVASVQYHVLADRAADAFYKLSNPSKQIQSYVFDGKQCFLNAFPFFNSINI